MPTLTASLRSIGAVLAVFSLVASGCSRAPSLDDGLVDSDYRADWERWRNDRRQALLDPAGWLTLTGLYWLDEGASTFGSGSDNDLVLSPAPSLSDRPATLGTFHRHGLEVTVESPPGSGLTLDGQPLESAVLLSPDGDSAVVMALGSVQFRIIERGGEVGLRLRDLESPHRHQLAAIETYPLSREWLFEARFEAAPDGRAIPIPTILGRTWDQASAGSVVFDLRGEEWRLDAIGDRIDEPLLLVVGDSTNGVDTYSGGRFVYVEVAPDGSVELDFHRLYNPPCVFTPYATCPLPPPQNRLPFPIEAGELSYAGH